MFTGIIESTGSVIKNLQSASNVTFWIKCSLSGELKIDQSVSHNGVCLTVEEIKGDTHRVTAIAETLEKTNLGNWKEGTVINIERCLKMDGRLDGHLVQGHVDTTGICINKTEKDGSWEYEFEFPESFAELIIEKGSICVNGISLTAFNVEKNRFTVAIIPYTYNHTSIQFLQKDEKVNLEFDVIGKYILRRIHLNGNN